MPTLIVRAPTAGALIALAALWSSAAIAELPTHRTVADLGPTQAEAPTGGEEFPFPLSDPGFGAAVAIRNGIAFVGIPEAFPTGHTAIYGQTATGWVRTATLSVLTLYRLASVATALVAPSLFGTAWR